MARILIVEDDEADRLLQGTILEAAGHQVFYAEDGAKALSLLEGRNVEVVITDLQMPNVHGLELITLLREMSPRPGIIAVSGTGSAQLDMAEMLGAVVTISKPITAGILLGAVAEVSSA